MIRPLLILVVLLAALARALAEGAGAHTAQPSFPAVAAATASRPEPPRSALRPGVSPALLLPTCSAGRHGLGVIPGSARRWSLPSPEAAVTELTAGSANRQLALNPPGPASGHALPRPQPAQLQREDAWHALCALATRAVAPPGATLVDSSLELGRVLAPAPDQGRGNTALRFLHLGAGWQGHAPMPMGDG